MVRYMMPAKHDVRLSERMVEEADSCGAEIQLPRPRLHPNSSSRPPWSARPILAGIDVAISSLGTHILEPLQCGLFRKLVAIEYKETSLSAMPFALVSARLGSKRRRSKLQLKGLEMRYKKTCGSIREVSTRLTGFPANNPYRTYVSSKLHNRVHIYPLLLRPCHFPDLYIDQN